MLGFIVSAKKWLVDAFSVLAFNDTTLRSQLSFYSHPITDNALPLRNAFRI